MGSGARKKSDLDYSDGVEVHGFQFGVQAPVDSESGGVVGKRRRQPVTIRLVDAASPTLYQALATNEVFKSVALRFGRIGPDGKPNLAGTLELTNASIVGIKPKANSGGKRCEVVTLVFDGVLVNRIPYDTIPSSFLC